MLGIVNRFSILEKFQPGAPLDAVVHDEGDGVRVGDVDLPGGFARNGHRHAGIEAGVAVAGVGLRRVIDASRNELDSCLFKNT